jgi:hypothetical protein
LSDTCINAQPGSGNLWFLIDFIVGCVLRTNKRFALSNET